MSLNYKEYSEAMDEFLVKMEQVPYPGHPDEQVALERVCAVLRISKIQVTVTETQTTTMEQQKTVTVPYQNGVCDESQMLCFDEKTSSNAEIVFGVYPYADAPKWDEEENRKIQILIKTMYVFGARKRTSHMIDHLIFHDSVLDVYNLAYYNKYCAELFQAGTIAKYGAAYFNLRRFSKINQQLGRDRATMVMSIFIEQLKEKLDEDEVICRIGGDNFVVLFHKEKLDMVIDHLKGRGIEYDEEEELAFISATAGFYLVSDNVKQADDIMDNASIAYNLAKNVNNEAYAIYSDETAERIKETKTIEGQFTEALQNGEFLVYYQPKVALNSYTLAGAEALCRWVHDGKMISPGYFIPVFEQSKAITLLDFYMLEHVCRDLARWIMEGRKVVKTSVNFSRRHLGNQDLAQQILSVIDRYEVPHEYLEIELTETTTDVDFKDLRKVVMDLQAAGISTSVDDFGMGYSSLNLIKELPWNVLKIDKSFLDPVAEGDEVGSIMLGHVISMAQEMGLECIVEGVETSEQVKFLKQHNCYLAQGYFFDRPLPKEEFEKRLADFQKS